MVDLEKFLYLYNNVKSKSEISSLIAHINNIVNRAGLLVVRTNSINAYVEGQRMAYVIESVKELSYIKHWVKAFGIVGLEDLRITSKYEIDTSRDDLSVLYKSITPMSIVKYNKVMVSNKSEYLKNKELKKTRNRNRYLRKLNRAKII